MNDSDFEANGISFYDSEDETDLGLDDGFDLIDKHSEGKRKRVKQIARKHKNTPNKSRIGDDNVGSSSGVNDEMETNFSSDELGSSDPDASDQENGPMYPRFKMKELDKNYKLKVGLKFVSLDEFKKAITECKY